MRKCVHQIILCVALLSLSFPIAAQEKLILSVIEGTPPAKAVSEILRQAYSQLGIQLKFQYFPALRGLVYSNKGETDGEAFRVDGIEKEYPNLVRVDVAVRMDLMYLFVKKGKGFVVNGWGSIPKEYSLCYQRGIKFAEYAVVEYGLQAETVETTEQLFRKLQRDRNDVILAGGSEGAQLISQLQYDNIIRLAPPIYTTYLYHYLHREHADLVPKITAVLEKMETRGEIEKIRDQVESEVNP
jgi:polar amino acid transport system substrate-binding protein